MRISPRAVAELAVAAGAASAATTHAQITAFYDRPSWEAAAGNTDRIDFFGAEPELAEQFLDRGIAFGAHDMAVTSAAFLDLAGARGPGAFLTVEFAAPINAVAFEFPHYAYLRLYNEHGQVGTQPFYYTPEIGVFGGVLSETPFSRVEVWEYINGRSLVDTVFWQVIPSPAGVTLLSGGLVAATVRRRR